MSKALSGVWAMISDCPVEPPVCWRRQESQVPSVEEESSRPEVLTPPVSGLVCQVYHSNIFPLPQTRANDLSSASHIFLCQ